MVTDRLDGPVLHTIAGPEGGAIPVDITGIDDNGNGLGGNTEENTELSESRKRSLPNLMPPWPKGTSGHPEGRPRRPITEAYADMADQKFPGDPKGRTYAQVAAEGQFKAGVKGKTETAREIADRLEGKMWSWAHR